MALSLEVPLDAQSNTGNVYGSVIDEQGSPIGGGLATLMGPAAPRTTSADANGLFRFLAVAPGKYSVAVTMPGFAPVTRENVLVSVGQNTQVDVRTQVAAVQESVTVTSAPPLIDARRVETGRTFTREELTEIPSARDVWSLIQQVPGVQLDTVNVAGNASAVVGGPAIADKGSGNVVYQVDGATVTGNAYGVALARQNGGTSMFFDFATLDNVEVATGGSILEQETSGVTINVVTKRGTNQLKGSARYLYASAAWQSRNTPQESLDQGLQTNSTRYIREYGGEVGGPILRDRLWLWAAGSRQDISVNPATFNKEDVPYPETTILEPWSAKLNAQIANANSAALYYQRSDRLEYGVGVAPDRPPETRTTDVIPTDFYKAEDSNVFSPVLFGSVFVSYQHAALTSIPIGGLDKDVQYYDSSWHNTFQYLLAKEPQKQANLQVSKFFNTGRVNHELKLSFNYRQRITDSAFGWPGSQNAGGDETFPGGPGSPIVGITRGVHKRFESQYWSGTLGDTLTAGSLTVAAGVRYDLQQAKNLPGISFENTMFPDLLPEVKYHGAKVWQYQFANWQPRVSATYALGERKNTLLRVSYARFADQLGNLGDYLSGTPTQNGYVYYWDDLNHDHNVQRGEILFDKGVVTNFNGLDPAGLPGNPNQIQPGLKTPATNELTAGVEHQLTDDFAVSGTFSYRNTSNLLSQIPIGTSLETYAFGGRAIGSATSVANGFTLNFDEPFYDLTLPEPPAGFELTNRPGATQRYYGADISVVKRLSNHWMVRGNFGWNSFRQYLTPQSIQNPNNSWGDGGQNDNGGLASGFSPKTNVWLNASWQFNINGLYEGPWGLSFGADLFGRQGYPNPYFIQVQTHDVANNEVPILIGKLDTHRYANVYQLDVRIQKTIQIGPLNVSPTAELFNVTNNNTVINSDPGVGNYVSESRAFEPNPHFNQIIEIQSPRIVRLGLQVNF